MSEGERSCLQRSQCTILLQGRLCLSERMEASLLYTTMAFVPIPPEVEKTWSENEAFSISVRVCVRDCLCIYVCAWVCVNVYVFLIWCMCLCVCVWVRMGVLAHVCLSALVSEFWQV